MRYPAHTTIKGRAIDPLAVYETIAKMTWQDQTSSFAIPPAANQADINRYIDEGLIQFITGQKPLNESSWSAFIQGLDGIGVADWETAANQALKDKGLE